MEEKNVQNNAELNEEQLEQIAGGRTTASGAQAQAAGTWACIICESCGTVIYYHSVYSSAKALTCQCGNVMHV